MPAIPERWRSACAAALAVAVLAGARAPTPPPTAADVVATHCRARAALATLRARFVQTRVFTAIGESERSAGVVLYRRPDSLRWEYTEPDRSFTVLQGGKGWAVFPGIRQVQRFTLGGARAEAILATVGFGACGDSFGEAFDVSLVPGAGPGPVLSLVPQRPEIASAFTRIELTLDPGDGLPRKILLHEAGGDSVSIELRDVQRGARIDRTLFEFNPPEGYSVVP